MLRNTFLNGLMGVTMLLGAAGYSNAADGDKCCTAPDCKCPAGCKHCEGGTCKEKCCCAPKASSCCGKGHKM